MSPEQLKKLRKHYNLTQSEVASLICVSAKSVQDYEAGRSVIPELVSRFLLLNFNVTLDDIDAFPVKEPAEKEKTPPKSSLGLMPFNEFKRKIPELQARGEGRIDAKNTLTFIDLFAGIGGIRRAFQNNGAACVFSSEIDQYAQYTYYANYGAVPQGDITKIKEQDVPDHDILCGGFPCQPFSHIGKREGFHHPTQGTMFFEVLRLIKAKKPKAIFLENVPGIVNHDDGRTLKTILESLTDVGYSCKYKILNAKDFGIPQNRARFYLVGFKGKWNSNFEFPEPTHEKADIGSIVETNVTGHSISKHLQKSYLFKKDDGRPNLIDSSSKGPMKTLVSSYHKIQRLTGTFVKDGETGIRLLTANECKAVMGFPKDFIIPVSRTQMYRQLGNSVVIKVIDLIARNLIASLPPKH